MEIKYNKYIKFDAIQSGWLIVYFEGSQVVISILYCFLFLKIVFLYKQTLQALMKWDVILI